MTNAIDCHSRNLEKCSKKEEKLEVQWLSSVQNPTFKKNA